MKTIEKNTWVNVKGFQFPTIVFGDSDMKDYMNVYVSYLVGPEHNVEPVHIDRLTMIDNPRPFSPELENDMESINTMCNEENHKEMWDNLEILMEKIDMDNHPEN